jgi:ribonuclease HI
VILKDGKEIKAGCRFIGIGEGITNNVAEYSALIRVLEWLKENNISDDIIINSDSQLIIGQMSQGWKVKAPLLIPLVRKARHLMKGMKIKYNWIPREENEKADMLSKLAYRRYVRKNAL